MSEALAALILIAAALSTISILYIFGSTLVGAQARQAEVTILEARAVKVGSSLVLRVTVGNTGTETLTLTSISLPGTGCSYSPGETLEPGTTYMDTYLCSPSPSPGTRLTVLVRAAARDGREVSDTSWVEV